jgi:hypothetical protein
MSIARTKPEFYLVSGETTPAIAPRACYILKTLSPPEGSDDYLLGNKYLLVRIDPRLRGEVHTGTIDLDELVLTNRGRGPIYPSTDWPGWVNICRILNEDIKRTGIASADDLYFWTMGGLWRTAEEAEGSLRNQFGPNSRFPRI